MMIVGGTMKSRMARLGLALAMTAPMTLADFRYDQTSRMTGGAMMSMMQLAARFNKNAMQPITSTVAVKGNRLVTNSNGKSAHIIDLDKETITDVNFDKKEYSVTTFAEMKSFLDKASLKSGTTETSIEVDVKDTGKEEVVNGLKAKEYLLTLKVDGTNFQTGQRAEMQMEMSNWIAPSMPGHKEMGDFYKRMAEKLDLAAAFGGGQPGMGKGMAAAVKKMAEMDGVPVMQIIRMIPADPEQAQKMQEMQAQQASSGGQQPQIPSAGQAAGDAAGQAAAGAVANKLGRFGGLGSQGLGGLGGMRRKKQEEQQQAAPPPPPAEAPAPPAVQGSFSTEASMIEMTMDSKNFSNASVDDSLFAVPAGFKVVKSPMQK